MTVHLRRGYANHANQASSVTGGRGGGPGGTEVGNHRVMGPDQQKPSSSTASARPSVLLQEQFGVAPMGMPDQGFNDEREFGDKEEVEEVEMPTLPAGLYGGTQGHKQVWKCLLCVCVGWVGERGRCVPVAVCHFRC
jgi:hypothetical protein